MRYTLKDVGLPYKKIMTGRSWVGRVAKCADGRFLGVIGQDKIYESTETKAFEAVVSRALGYESADALRAHNSRVRSAKRAQRQTADAVVNEMLRGNFAPFEKLLGRM